MGDTSIKFEVIPGKNQKSEYVMTCGKHTVRGWCKYNLGVASESPLPLFLFSFAVHSEGACSATEPFVCLSCSSLVSQF